MTSASIRRCDAGDNAGIQDDGAAAGLCRGGTSKLERNEFVISLV